MGGFSSCLVDDFRCFERITAVFLGFNCVIGEVVRAILGEQVDGFGVSKWWQISVKLNWYWD